MKGLTIGITGGFGTGKSTVARMFGDLGAYVIDADTLAHKLMRPGRGGVYKKIIAVFGKGILKKNTIQRRALARIVFSDTKLLKKLNALTHPFVIKEIQRLVRTANKKIIVIDAPLLIEAGLAGSVDILIVVRIAEHVQTKRCIKRGFSRDDTERRRMCQLPLSKKMRMADFIIDNSGDLNLTRAQVKRIWMKIKEEAYWDERN